MKKHLQLILACACTTVCVLFVCVAVLYSPSTKPADKKQNKIEYTPPARSTDHILLCCNECGGLCTLILDYEQQSASLLRLSDKESAYSQNKQIAFDEKLICALVDNIGGISFTLMQDTPILSAGSWRLTGNQVWRLLHLGDEVVFEQLVEELFYSAFTFGLQNDQIYIILENSNCDGLSYSQLYSIAHYSKDWLSQLTVIC